MGTSSLVRDMQKSGEGNFWRRSLRVSADLRAPSSRLISFASFVSFTVTSPKTRPNAMLSGQKDVLSTLPFEVFSMITHNAIDPSTYEPLSTLKSLSQVNKQIREYCIAWGLFKSFLVTRDSGLDSLALISSFLSNPHIAQRIQTLTLHDTIIGDSATASPSALSDLLQQVPQLRTLRIKGLPNSELLSQSRLVTVNGLLYETLSSGRYLTNLRKIELFDFTLTQYTADIVSAMKGITHLSMERIKVSDSTSVKGIISKDIQFLRFHGLQKSIENVLKRGQENCFQNVTCLSFEIGFGYPETWVKDKESSAEFKRQFPNLKTLSW